MRLCHLAEDLAVGFLSRGRIFFLFSFFFFFFLSRASLISVPICIGLHLALREIRLATSYFFRALPRAEVFHGNSTEEDMDQVIHFLMAPKRKRCLIRCLGPS